MPQKPLTCLPARFAILLLASKLKSSQMIFQEAADCPLGAAAIAVILAPHPVNGVQVPGGNGAVCFQPNVSFGLHTEADLSCVSDLEGDLTLPAIVMKTADDRFCVGWLASQTDMLADDWFTVE